MNQRAFSAGEKPGTPDEPKGRDAPSTAPAHALERAQVFAECTRAVLRATDETAIAATVCQLLVHPGVYAEACVFLFDSTPEAGRSFYAGSHKSSLKEPGRFWAAPPRKAALERLIGDPACALVQVAGGDCVLRLTLDGRTIGALAVAPAPRRSPQADELERLGALAEDVTFAVSRLREAAPDLSLAISERRLRETVEHAGVGITRIDINGRFLEVNQKFCEMLDYTREELIGRATREVTVAEDYGPGAAFRAQARLGRVRMHIGEKRYQRKDGSHLWARRTMSPALDENGKVRDVISIVEDITERKRIEKALQEHVERFELAARATSDAIWDWDLTAGTLWWGEGLEKLFDHRREDIGAAISGWTDRIHPDEVKAVGDGIHAAIDGGASSWSAEYRFRRGNGTWADVYDRAYIMRDEQGRAMRVLGAMMDISDRKGGEEAMRRERLLLRAIIDALPDYIHVKDAQGRFQLCNAAWLAARHAQDVDLHGKTVFDLFPPAIAERMETQDRQIIATGEAVRELEHPISVLDEGGTLVRHWSSTTKVPMRDEDGTIVGIVGFSRDITTRRRMERERAMEHAVAGVLSESRSVEDTMPRLIRTICEAMDWTYGAHWVWDASTKALKRVAWWCEFEPEFDPADEPYWKEISALHTKGLLGKAWLGQRATWVSDIEKMEDFRREPSCRKLRLRSGYAFPILARDEPVGVIEFFGREPREPDEAMLEVSGAISNQIGQFIRRKEAEESLQESEQQLRAVFENADVGIAMSGLDMQYLRVNDKYCSIVGYDRDELVRMRVQEVNLESNIEAMREYRERMMRDAGPGFTVEKQLVRRDGTLVWVSMATSLVRASDGAPRYFISVIQDISDNKRAAEALKESEEQFRILAHFDLLTGLPNRALFYDRLAHALALARRNRWWLAVLFIDVDRFKHVNDTFGHAAGDQLLKQVSERLAECVRSDDTVGRLSGDEFAIVLSRLTAPGDAAVVSTKIIEELNKPFMLEGTELFVTASIGITVFPTDSVEQDALIRNADVAMYRAKDRGRNNYQFYTPEMNRRTREMLNMESELRRAIERDELVLHYQPKVSLTTGLITGVEALLRWQHPERGLVPPGDFIPLLEETGLVVQAGQWVLRAVCRQLNDWRSRGVAVVPVAVNLSARQFLSPDLGPMIKSILEESNVGPELLEVEITESAIMTDVGEANRTLEYLQTLGVASAIDDFGTGYSSLGYLKRFPLRALKVDRSFVNDITTDADDAHITQAVISMAHSLGLKVIAEGVETEAQLAFLLRYGCDEVQGFLFSRPVPADACAAAIADYLRAAALIDVVRHRAP